MSRLLPETDGALDWGHPKNPNDLLPRTVAGFNKYDADRNIEQPGNVRFDNPDAPTPAQQAILDQHPELKGIHRQIVTAYNNAGGAFYQDGKPGWSWFQEELSKTVDLSDPRNKELVARWTWWVMDRETGSPPWFRTGTST